MSSRISLWVGLIGIAATIPLVQSIASAKTSVEIADTATAITVLITAPKDKDGFIPNGSELFSNIKATSIPFSPPLMW
ncbi:hypothetical protein [Chamaesiphon sp. VAR_48_metabat_135_sub]|uniref:hypothetical protein n=1 Tax=Chamaesiphon sp. VAR_48_metabat_135_sub TaxID=2964699 RepID=UPI00286BAF89|nr:hypothetical protein [Chamaesiphon sp. VAR_48_metabat_135_sub]